MLFVAIGLITLFGSFLVALVILIRELGQRPDIDETLIDYPLDLVEAVVPVESSRAEASQMAQEASSESSFNEPVPASDLAEVVPFPWVMENVNQTPRQKEPEKPQETEIFSQGQKSSESSDSNAAKLADASPTEPVRGLNRRDLDGVVSLSDLASKN